MRLDRWKALPTWLKLVSLMDAYNMAREVAEAKLREWGDWKDSDSKCP